MLFGSYAKGEANDKSDVDYSDSINNSIACVFN
ncbi:nucleotidyltransferase domain-containing protein [Clostridium sp. Cult1]